MDVFVFIRKVYNGTLWDGQLGCDTWPTSRAPVSCYPYLIPVKVVMMVQITGWCEVMLTQLQCSHFDQHCVLLPLPHPPQIYYNGLGNRMSTGRFDPAAVQSSCPTPCPATLTLYHRPQVVRLWDSLQSQPSPLKVVQMESTHLSYLTPIPIEYWPSM